MSEFDALKAAHEELAGLRDVRRVLVQRGRRAEEAVSEAESEVNALRKLIGYCDITIEQLKQRIDSLSQTEKEGQ